MLILLIRTRSDIMNVGHSINSLSTFVNGHKGKFFFFRCLPLNTGISRERNEIIQGYF